VTRSIFTHIRKWAIVLLCLIIFLVQLIHLCGVAGLPECANRGLGTPLADNVTLTNMREIMSNGVKSSLSSPHAELVLGMVLGLNAFKELPTFNDILIRSGTIHVVVVSGYNINLIFTFLAKLFGSNLKFSTLLLTQFCAVIFAVISGFEPPVVRALLMVSILTWGYAFGRRVNVFYVFLVSVLAMLAIQPLYLFSLSFQLSCLASLGLLIFSTPLSTLIGKYIRSENVFLTSFAETASAQLFVWPLIAFHFERVSLLGLLSNTATLWTVPFITIVGALVVVISLIHPVAGRAIGVLIHPFSSIFITVNTIVAQSGFSEISVKPGKGFIACYYILLLLISILLYFRRAKVT
jgi:competence protein ComEC